MDFFTLLVFYYNHLVMMALKIMVQAIFVYHKEILVSKDLKMMADKLSNVFKLTLHVMKDLEIMVSEIYVYQLKALALKDTKMMEEVLKTVF